MFGGLHRAIVGVVVVGGFCAVAAGGLVSACVISGDTHSVLAYEATTGAFERTRVSGGGLVEPEGMAHGPDRNPPVAGGVGNAVLEYDAATGTLARAPVLADSGGMADPTFMTTGPSPAPASIPLPPAVVPGLLSLGGVMALSLRRRGSMGRHRAAA